MITTNRRRTTNNLIVQRRYIQNRTLYNRVGYLGISLTVRQVTYDLARTVSRKPSLSASGRIPIPIYYYLAPRIRVSSARTSRNQMIFNRFLSHGLMSKVHLDGNFFPDRRAIHLIQFKSTTLVMLVNFFVVYSTNYTAN